MTTEQAEPLLQGGREQGIVSVRFAVAVGECCCYNFVRCLPCCSCCGVHYKDEKQLVVPDTTTVGEFLNIVNRLNNAKEPYIAAFIGDYQLRESDLVAPTIRSYEKFESPMIVVPSSQCCLLI